MFRGTVVCNRFVQLNEKAIKKFIWGLPPTSWKFKNNLISINLKSNQADS